MRLPYDSIESSLLLGLVEGTRGGKDKEYADWTRSQRGKVSRKLVNYQQRETEGCGLH